MTIAEALPELQDMMIAAAHLAMQVMTTVEAHPAMKEVIHDHSDEQNEWNLSEDPSANEHPAYDV